MQASKDHLVVAPSNSKGCKRVFPKSGFDRVSGMVGHQTATVISVDLHPVQFYTKTDDLLVATFLCKKLVRTHNLVPHSEGLCLHPVQEPQKEPNAFHSSHGATHQGASKRLIFPWKSFSFLFCTALLLSRLQPIASSKSHHMILIQSRDVHSMIRGG